LLQRHGRSELSDPIATKFAQKELEAMPESGKIIPAPAAAHGDKGDFLLSCLEFLAVITENHFRQLLP